ncbi:MAG: energy-coupling factor transporter transmembrane component T [Syntrophobacteraceae bacterium]
MPRGDRSRFVNASRAHGLRSKAQSYLAPRIRTWVKLLCCMALCILDCGSNTVAALAALTGVNMLLLYLFRCGFHSLWRGAKVFIRQTVIVAGLYIIRYGLDDGLWPGIRVSWQLFLAFLPGAIFVMTTPQPRILQTMAGIMPCRAAFVMATCLRFTPLVIDEIGSIHEGQVLRGAKILPRDLLRPWNWPDVINCLIVPTIIRSLDLAGEIALAAKARDFGVNGCRTFWPGS